MRKYLIFSLLVVALVLVIGCGEAAEPIGYTDLSPAEAKALIDSNPDIVIIDVSPHYDEGHLPGAVHYYIGDGSLDAAIPTLDPSKTYLVYCRSGNRSSGAVRMMEELGFEKVYNMLGGIVDWQDAGFPTVQ